MKTCPGVIEDLDNLVLPTGELHLAIGMFDGVHLGHQAVIEAAIHSAKRTQGVSGVLTFYPHPSQVFGQTPSTQLIMTPEQKVRQLCSLGVDRIFQLHFNTTFAQITADDFLPWLHEKFSSLGAIYVGENFRFGANRMGTVDTLIKTGKPFDIHTFSIERIKHNGTPISSTRIRQELQAGNIRKVNTLLGYTYYSEGTVIQGAHRGTAFGFPTLNFSWDAELRPKYGVYAVHCQSYKSNEIFNGVANFGVRPTVTQDTEPTLEVHCLQATNMQVGDHARIGWLDFLRPERQFPSSEALKEQIAKDCKQALAIFDHDPLAGP